MHAQHLQAGVACNWQRVHAGGMQRRSAKGGVVQGGAASGTSSLAATLHSWDAWERLATQRCLPLDAAPPSPRRSAAFPRRSAAQACAAAAPACPAPLAWQCPEAQVGARARESLRRGAAVRESEATGRMRAWHASVTSERRGHSTRTCTAADMYAKCSSTRPRVKRNDVCTFKCLHLSTTSQNGFCL